MIIIGLLPFSLSNVNTIVLTVLKALRHMKRYTQRIERTNLTLRSRIKRLARKTIGFSKSEEIHDKVIGTFIERECYI